MLLISTDDSGNVLNYHEYGYAGKIEGLGFDITTDGGYICTGLSDFSNNSEIILIKTGVNGKF